MKYMHFYLFYFAIIFYSNISRSDCCGGCWTHLPIKLLWLSSLLLCALWLLWCRMVCRTVSIRNVSYLVVCKNKPVTYHLAKVFSMTRDAYICRRLLLDNMR